MRPSSPLRILFLCMIILFCTSSSRAETITLVADGWCPYNCAPVSEKPGYVIEIAQAIFGKHGITVEYQLAPWSRSIEMVERGEAHGLVGVSKGDARDLIYPTETIGQNINHFYVAGDSSWHYQGIHSLESIRLGLVEGYYYNDALERYIVKNRDNPQRLVFATGEHAIDENYHNLMKKVSSAFIANSNIVQYFIKNTSHQGDLKSVGALEHPDKEEMDLYIAFSPEFERSKDYAAMLNAGIIALRKSGKLGEILARYGLKDWQK